MATAMNSNVQTAPALATAEEAGGGEQVDGSPQPVPRSRSTSPSLLHRLSGLFRSRNGSSLREDLTDALTASAAEFSPAERAMLNNILRLREVRVEDVILRRSEVEAVDLTTTLGELLMVFERSGHSRMPVYSETLDDPRGMVHIRDVLV